MRAFFSEVKKQRKTPQPFVYSGKSGANHFLMVKDFSPRLNSGPSASISRAKTSAIVLIFKKQNKQKKTPTTTRTTRKPISVLQCHKKKVPL